MLLSKKPQTCNFEVWQISPEISPYAQSGGLAHVVGSLSSALVQLGVPVRQFLPAYNFIKRDGFVRDDAEVAVPLGDRRVLVRFFTKAESDGVKTTLVEGEDLLDREHMYGPPGRDYPDNAQRFALFSRSVCEFVRRAATRPGILHCHDWGAALAPMLAQHLYRWPFPTRSLLNIHNLAYQGVFDASDVGWLSLGRVLSHQLFTPSAMEYHGRLSFLKAGLTHAGQIATVSPSYAEEILTPESGFGLDGVLRERRGALTGILNGIDDKIWDPTSDHDIPYRYGADDFMEKKIGNQRALGKMAGISSSGRPLLSIVGRLTPQKGFDLMLETAPRLLKLGLDLYFLGSGDPQLAGQLKKLKEQFPQRVGIFLGHDEAHAHLVFSASDMVIVPSRFEPCGLVQMYALRYGAVPIVSATGGLKDTIVDVDEDRENGNGFTFAPLTAKTLVDAVARATKLRAKDPTRWMEIQHRGMTQDLSWKQSALRYIELYEKALA